MRRPLLNLPSAARDRIIRNRIAAQKSFLKRKMAAGEVRRTAPASAQNRPKEHRGTPNTGDVIPVCDVMGMLQKPAESGEAPRSCGGTPSPHALNKIRSAP